METFIGTAAGLRQPSPCRGLRVEARRIGFYLQELNEVLAVLNAHRAGRAIRIPHSVMQIDVLPERRIGLDQIAAHSVDEVARLALCERRQMCLREVKRHEDAP
ncbi:hypothetical protein L0Z42_13665 [Burkholderia multivorans]|uniref:hypothetical protein n=1 Tax=Burkholderia multivorans TaxID=87883 RepID=UPI0020198545|nr:hypothetical protein [Burkholderia multivorans]MCO1371584.1 hypothetical protein [Burkholderia multivorans]MCO1457168.1 hypothetical protein [Burkholderia multivorans]MCO1466154.1 hypothetical protein [Burkholderia multivorans]UQO16147.1 hypothetical protein L0Z02_11110 [Burkholderia multivorans]UQO86484.1 hypothetical protein L0Y86_15340 [Burkholderia multivorans]